MKSDKTGDTCGKPLFKEFQIDIKKEFAYQITGYDEFKTSFTSNNFSAKITIFRKCVFF